MATRSKKKRTVEQKGTRPQRVRSGAGTRRQDEAARLAILNEIARTATLDLELRPMLQRITDALAEQFGWEFIACVLVDHTRDRFICEALTTRLDTIIHVGFTRSLASGVVGNVGRTGRTVLLNDVRRSKNYVASSPEIQSELCVPVRHRGSVVAVLNLESARLGAFRDEKKLLETIAEQVAGAIANARLFEEVRRRAGLLEMVSEISRLALDAGALGPLLDRVVGYIHERFRLTATGVLLLDESGERFELASRAGVPPPQERIAPAFSLTGIVGRAMRTGLSQLVTDVRRDPDYVMIQPDVVAELVIPIRYHDRILGALNLESSEAAVFSEESRVVMETLASQVAGGIHMARVNRRLADTNRLVEERTRELELVNHQLQLANAVLHRLSTHDGLTGISNRRQFDDVLALEWRRAQRVGGSISLVMADIDFFKAYNDTYGHQAGDDTLKEVAYTLQDLVHRAGDLLARYGGEEFAVILPGQERGEALAFAETMRQRIEAREIRHEHSEVSPFVTVSFGVTSARVIRGLETTDLVAAADRALYAAKNHGRNRVEFQEPARAVPGAGDAYRECEE